MSDESLTALADAVGVLADDEERIDWSEVFWAGVSFTSMTASVILAGLIDGGSL